MDDAEFEKLLSDEQLKNLLKYRLEQAFKTANPEQKKVIKRILLLSVDLTASQALTLSNSLLMVACLKDPAFRTLIKE